MLENVIIFGCGKYFQKKLETLQKKYHIVGFLDNAVENEKLSDEFGCYIYNPQRWELLPKCSIIIMSIHFIEIWDQLIGLGVPSERIKIGQNIVPFYDIYEKIMFSNKEYIKVTKDRLCYVSEDEEICFRTKVEYNSIKRTVFLKNHTEIEYWNQFQMKSIDPDFGIGRGKAIDRVYIEEFIEKYKKDIRGTVMEIQDNRYLKRFGEDRVKKEIILHAEYQKGVNHLKGNFATGEGLSEHMVDCLICTQTLQYIYDLQSTAKNIYKILKRDGIALITVPGIKTLSTYHDAKWGEYWSFTKRSIYQMFVDVFGKDNIEVGSYGNVKVTMAYLYGLCAEDLMAEDFGYNDENCPFIIAARLQKK